VGGYGETLIAETRPFLDDAASSPRHGTRRARAERRAMTLEQAIEYALPPAGQIDEKVPPSAKRRRDAPTRLAGHVRGVSVEYALRSSRTRGGSKREHEQSTGHHEVAVYAVTEGDPTGDRHAGQNPPS
jgi:hypothetical protein